MAKKVDVDWSAFRALVLSGLAIRDVARRLGVNPNTALARAKRDKWDVAKSHGHGRKPDIPKEALARTELSRPERNKCESGIGFHTGSLLKWFDKRHKYRAERSKALIV
jgi:hypothetical protein